MFLTILIKICIFVISDEKFKIFQHISVKLSNFENLSHIVCVWERETSTKSEQQDTDQRDALFFLYVVSIFVTFHNFLISDEISHSKMVVYNYSLDILKTKGLAQTYTIKI